jgi:heat shock protein HslJ
MRILFGIAFVLFVACSASKETTLPTGEWMLKTLPGEDLSILNKPITLKFDSVNTKAAGFAGCNQYFSSYSINQSSIEFSNVGSTKMFCEQTMGLENKFLEALSKSNAFKVNGNKLQLLQDDLVLLEFEK